MEMSIVLQEQGMYPNKWFFSRLHLDIEFLLEALFEEEYRKGDDLCRNIVFF